MMEKFNFQELLASLEKKPLNKEVFCVTDHLKAQVIYLKSGNTIPPCRMDNDVLFYIVSGEGSINVDDETKPLQTGDCVIVPNTSGYRSIKAETDLHILAVQGLPNN
jgi:mannose-6-phosphate isomerase-like protein (cupin superfamily)